MGECEKGVEEGDLSAKEKNNAKALLLQSLVRVSMCNDAVVSDEKLATMYRGLIGSEKLSHATKRVLESVKPYIAL